jgi:hypothetical protein
VRGIGVAFGAILCGRMETTPLLGFGEIVAPPAQGAALSPQKMAVVRGVGIVAAGTGIDRSMGMVFSCCRIVVTLEAQVPLRAPEGGRRKPRVGIVAREAALVESGVDLAPVLPRIVVTVQTKLRRHLREVLGTDPAVGIVATRAGLRRWVKGATFAELRYFVALLAGRVGAVAPHEARRKTGVGVVTDHAALFEGRMDLGGGFPGIVVTVEAQFWGPAA